MTRNAASETAAAAPKSLSPFHLAVQVHDLVAAREFYGELLGCPEGRSADTWVDFDFFGHQFVCHLNKEKAGVQPHYNEVDGHGVPVPHFGVVLDLPTWEQLAERLTALDVKFVIAPYIRFAGQPGEQGTMFFFDPSGNAVEIKGFRDLGALFAK
ncbi:glyoxalase [Blastopirellula marina]|uniref:Glyoxalase n=1 Tax=Blastopirellula marina TaxID=124 RepID=A0A2S8GK33_9BACT|nr:glyoxalase [Blastopirellula marina]